MKRWLKDGWPTLLLLVFMLALYGVSAIVRGVW